MLHERVLQRIDAIVPSDVTHVGFVLRDIAGSVSVLVPKSPKHGVTATLPRIQRHPGERPSDAVQRCLREVIGGDVQFAFPISPVVWHTPNSRTYYFASAVHAASPEFAPQLHWYPAQQAWEALQAVAYAPTRERNVEVLELVCKTCLCPYRRVLEMVRELHAMGYERLRAPAYMYPLAWRCPVVPAAWTLKEHGGLMSNVIDSSEVGIATYTGALGQVGLFQDYEAANVEFAPPAKLAEEFVRMRPKMAYAGWGPDAKYAKWLQGALKKLEPHGLFHAFAEMESPRDTLYTMFTPVESIKRPPGGLSSESEWDSFAAKHRSKGPM